MFDFFASTLSLKDQASLSAHIGRHFGEPDNILHELKSKFVHLDVYVVNPSTLRPRWTLVTGGMSARGMKVPKGSGLNPFAELVITLPAYWKMDEKDFFDER